MERLQGRDVERNEAMRDTIEMAFEAGWKDLRDHDSEMRHDFFMGNTDSLKAFEALVRADERGRMCEQLKECSSEKPTSNEANRSAVLGEGG
jgi:hypothetical protein